MTLKWWMEPTAGEIVWCHFPDDINPKAKPRPAMILVVFDDDAPQFHVRVVYGTSQRVTNLHPGEFSIIRSRNEVAYIAAGLSYDTKFDLKQTIDLPYTSEWFSVPPTAPHGNNPILGTLHPSLVRAAAAAHLCCQHRSRRLKTLFIVPTLLRGNDKFTFSLARKRERVGVRVFDTAHHFDSHPQKS